MGSISDLTYRILQERPDIETDSGASEFYNCSMQNTGRCVAGLPALSGATEPSLAQAAAGHRRSRAQVRCLHDLFLSQSHRQAQVVLPRFVRPAHATTLKRPNL